MTDAIGRSHSFTRNRRGFRNISYRSDFGCPVGPSRSTCAIVRCDVQGNRSVTNAVPAIMSLVIIYDPCICVAEVAQFGDTRAARIRAAVTGTGRVVASPLARLLMATAGFTISYGEGDACRGRTSAHILLHPRSERRQSLAAGLAHSAAMRLITKCRPIRLSLAVRSVSENCP